MKSFIGQVVSTKSEKTVIVVIERYSVSRIYEKRVKRTKRYPVHDELGVRVGDKVSFVETRPISRTKKWKIVKVISKSTKDLKPEAKKEKIEKGKKK